MSRPRVDRNAPSEILGRLAQDPAKLYEEEEEEVGRALALLLAENGFDLYASAANELTEEQRRQVRIAAIAGSNEVESLIRIIERLTGERFLP